jgi:hypothetical protein
MKAGIAVAMLAIRHLRPRRDRRRASSCCGRRTRRLEAPRRARCSKRKRGGAKPCWSRAVAARRGREDEPEGSCRLYRSRCTACRRTRDSTRTRVRARFMSSRARSSHSRRSLTAGAASR